MPFDNSFKKSSISCLIVSNRPGLVDFIYTFTLESETSFYIPNILIAILTPSQVIPSIPIAKTACY